MMPRGVREDLTGQQFSKLTVVELAGSLPVGKAKRPIRHYYCECTCGGLTLAAGGDLKKGSVVSCGHCPKTKPEKESEPYDNSGINNGRFRHGAKIGGKATPEYKAWLDMKHDHSYSPEFEDFKEFFKAIGWKPSP